MIVAIALCGWVVGSLMLGLVWITLGPLVEALSRLQQRYWDRDRRGAIARMNARMDERIRTEPLPPLLLDDLYSAASLADADLLTREYLMDEEIANIRALPECAPAPEFDPHY